MLTTKLYVPLSGHSANGGADIHLRLPSAGTGLCQFTIQRAGQIDNILGPKGWQSSDYWFESESATTDDSVACVHLTSEIVRQLGISNYKITSRWRDNSQIAHTILQGGSLVPNPRQAKPSEVSVAPLAEDQLHRLPAIEASVVSVAPLSAQTASTVSEPSLSANVTSKIQPSPIELTLQEKQADASANSSVLQSQSKNPALLLISGLVVALALGAYWMSSNKPVTSTADTLPANSSSARSGSSSDPSYITAPTPNPLNSADAKSKAASANGPGSSAHEKMQIQAAANGGSSKNPQPQQQKSSASSSTSAGSGANGQATPDLNRLVIDAIKK